VALRFEACRSTILVPNWRELAAEAVKDIPDLDTPEAIDKLAYRTPCRRQKHLRQSYEWKYVDHKPEQ